MPDAIEIKPGKWTTQGGFRAVVNAWSEELNLWIGSISIGQPPWESFSWHRHGNPFGGVTAYRLISPGWPLELRDGGWYLHKDYGAGQLFENPKWAALRWRFFTRGSSLLLIDDEARRFLTEELPEPPAWAKEGT